MPDRRACSRSKWAKIPQKYGLSLGRVFTRSGPKAALLHCPHLNPIERLWGLMRKNVTHPP